MGWCFHAGAQLFTADFNGDRKTDLMCHDANGYKWIALSGGSGYYFKDKTSW